MKILLLTFILCLSCQHKRYQERVAFNLQSFDNFIITNANTNTYESMIKNKNTSKYSVFHTFIVKNTLEKKRSVNLKSAEIKLNSEIIKGECKRGSKKVDRIDIKGNSLSEFYCFFNISANDRNQLKLKDTTAIISLNLNDSILNFKQLIYRRDFNEN